MIRDIHRSDTAFILARSVLREKVGFAGATYVEQYYKLFRSEHDILRQLIEQLEFELEAKEIAIIEYQHRWLTRCAEATVQEVISNWSNSTARNQRLKLNEKPASTDVPLITSSGIAIDVGALVSCSAEISQHEDFMWSYIRCIHSIVGETAFEINRITNLLKELDNEALLLLKQLDDFQERILDTIARIKTLHTIPRSPEQPHTSEEDLALRDQEEFTFLDWKGNPTANDPKVDSTVHVGQEQRRASDLDFGFVFI